MDVRDKLEEAGYPYRKKETGYSTAHPTENKIAELYGLNCEQLTYDPKDVDGNNSKTTNVVKSLLKGNPVIAIAHNGVFTVGGHYIVIAGVLRDNIDSLKDKCGLTAADINTLKTRDKPLTDTLIISKIDALKYDDLKDLSIYVLDPRYRHEYKRTKAEKKDGSNAKTMSTAWDIDTFKNGGAGNVNKFWIYTKGNNTENINQSELFNYNKTKYPSNYEEYFKPQTPKDSDEFCKVTKEDKRELGYFRKMQQDWKLHDFPNLVNYGG